MPGRATPASLCGVVSRACFPPAPARPAHPPCGRRSPAQTSPRDTCRSRDSTRRDLHGRGAFRVHIKCSLCNRHRSYRTPRSPICCRVCSKTPDSPLHWLAQTCSSTSSQFFPRWPSWKRCAVRVVRERAPFENSAVHSEGTKGPYQMAEAGSLGLLSVAPAIGAQNAVEIRRTKVPRAAGPVLRNGQEACAI